MCIELETLQIERIYILGTDNVLGDAVSRNPIDREVARNLPLPLWPVQQFIHKMFWASDELAGRTAERVAELKLLNLGVLTYLPEEIASQGKELFLPAAYDELSEPWPVMSVPDPERDSDDEGFEGAKCDYISMRQKIGKVERRRIDLFQGQREHLWKSML